MHKRMSDTRSPGLYLKPGPNKYKVGVLITGTRLPVARRLWNRKVADCVHKTLLLYFVLSQIKSVRVLPPNLWVLHWCKFCVCDKRFLRSYKTLIWTSCVIRFLLYFHLPKLNSTDTNGCRHCVICNKICWVVFSDNKRANGRIIS